MPAETPTKKPSKQLDLGSQLSKELTSLQNIDLGVPDIWQMVTDTSSGNQEPLEKQGKGNEGERD